MASVPSWAWPGVKCMCRVDPTVPGTGNGRDPRAVYPENGGIYTIRRIVFSSYDGAALFLLNEINNHNPSIWPLEPGFDARHFRPLEDAADSEIEATLYRKRKAQKNQHIPHLGTVS